MSVYLPEPGWPCAVQCGICSGPRTLYLPEGPSPDDDPERNLRVHAHACMRCDTASDGTGWGPPVFMKIWDARKAM